MPIQRKDDHLTLSQCARLSCYDNLAQLLVLADSTAKDFMQQDGTILVEIVRALYGLPDSAKRWNSHFWWLCAM